MTFKFEQFKYMNSSFILLCITDTINTTLNSNNLSFFDRYIRLFKKKYPFVFKRIEVTNNGLHYPMKMI